MNDSIAFVWVKFDFEGWHRWPAAPPHRAYLAHRHRHLFKCAVAVEVDNDDREIEFHDLLDLCVESAPGHELGAQSCEMIARRLLNEITRRVGPRRVIVSVSEDGEVGATVSNYIPHLPFVRGQAE